jgi:hypothetical protein
MLAVTNDIGLAIPRIELPAMAEVIAIGSEEADMAEEPSMETAAASLFPADATTVAVASADPLTLYVAVAS